MSAHRPPASANFADKLAHSLAMLQTHVPRHAGDWVQAHSMGAEDVVVTHLLRQTNLLPRVRLVLLDTGALHPDTLAMAEQVEQAYGITVQRQRPEPLALAAWQAQHTLSDVRQSLATRQACCALRKIRPLQAALQGSVGWITGMRREQSEQRHHTPEADWDGQRHKLSPLADWTWGDVWQHITLHHLAYHPLHDAHYPSIGCQPCTRAISAGEPFRAGRWWWEQDQAKECGLHASPAVSSPLTPSRP
jgi:phosphoadenosine phosphosulfate reductase